MSACCLHLSPLSVSARTQSRCSGERSKDGRRERRMSWADFKPLFHGLHCFELCLCRRCRNSNVATREYICSACACTVGVLRLHYVEHRGHHPGVCAHSRSEEPRVQARHSPSELVLKWLHELNPVKHELNPVKNVTGDAHLLVQSVARRCEDSGQLARFAAMVVI